MHIGVEHQVACQVIACLHYSSQRSVVKEFFISSIFSKNLLFKKIIFKIIQASRLNNNNIFLKGIPCYLARQHTEVFRSAIVANLNFKIFCLFLFISQIVELLQPTFFYCDHVA